MSKDGHQFALRGQGSLIDGQIFSMVVGGWLNNDWMPQCIDGFATQMSLDSSAVPR
jgi:hypothetical protein